MGLCFSKKTSSSSSSLLVLEAPPPPPPLSKPKPNPNPTTSISPPQQTPVSVPSLISNNCNNKKEIFFIKQRNSHEREKERRPEQQQQDIQQHNILPIPNSTTTTKSSSSSSSPSPSSGGIVAASASAPVSVVIRTSSCTKEEVDAILIQCGRLSRSSSGKNNSSETAARKYSGSKRSYDFDYDTCTTTTTTTDQQQGHDKDKDKLYSPHRIRTRRTPSRETDLEYKRSSSNRRHRSSSTSRDEDRKRDNQNQNQSGGGGSRRLSRSPARRSETTTTTTTSSIGPGPAKMVSVPASTTGAIKRVSVKRTTASPRSQSPANANAREPSLSLSRNSSSRKPDNSPYRRNPLTEIDDNVLRSQQINNHSHTTDQGIPTNKNFQVQKSDGGGIGNQKSVAKNQNEPAKLQSSGIQAGDGGIEDVKLPQTTITRSRSSRRSRDLDLINDDVLVNVPTSTSYASILLEDIQNFHHKNSNATAAFSLPPCVAKACSILDAVADLNSSTNSNITSTEDRNSRTSNNTNITNNVSSFNVHLGKTRTRLDVDPFVQEETEVLVSDDLMEPSIHKYITVRRGMAEEMEQQESSGSNSIVGQGQGQQWFASSSWEPSSGDSTDHWYAGSDEGVVLDKEEPRLLVGHKKAGSRKSRSSTHLTTSTTVTLSGKKRELDHQLSKVGAKTQTAPIAAAASM